MSCPICLDPFKDPVVLPCGHSFCRTTCTKGLVRRGRIACPTCRKVHLAPGGVKGLPKNYALEEVIEEKPISDPLCPDHLDERVNLFCTQCYVPVCVKCCLCRRVRGHSAGHWEHQVIPLDQMKAYIQGLLSVAEGYLASRRREECNYLEKLMAAEERIQEEEEPNRQTSGEHSHGIPATGSPPMPLDGCCVHHRGIGEQSQQVTDRLIQYDCLLRRCQEMATSSGKEDSVWTKLPEFRCLLQSLDHLPDPPPPIMALPITPHHIMDSPDPLPPPIMDPPSSDIHPPTIDLSKAIADVTKCFMPVQGKPCSPKLLPHECVVDQRSVSLTWTYDPSDHIGYFTVYYETAIFTNGLCSNMTSVTVTDFGPSFGHVTLHDLDPETRYKISVTASNEFGESSPTEHLYCRTSATKTELCLL